MLSDKMITQNDTICIYKSLVDSTYRRKCSLCLELARLRNRC